MIHGYESFTYLGYIARQNQKPTLYFKEGHYIQEDDDANEVGWHVAPPFQHGENVNPEFLGSFMMAFPYQPPIASAKQSDRESSAPYDQLIHEFFEGKYKSDHPTAIYTIVCKCTLSQPWNLVCSNGKLFGVESKSFHQAYGKKYAKDVLAKGHFSKADLCKSIYTSAATYLGYIDGNTSMPTLVFLEGTYVQEYERDPKQVGWHPVYTGGNNLSLNLTREDVTRLKKEVDNPDKPLDLSEYEHSTQPHAVYVLAEQVGHARWNILDFNGRLVKENDPEFDDQFNSAYANAVLCRGHFVYHCNPNKITSIEALDSGDWNVSGFSSVIQAACLNNTTDGLLKPTNQETLFSVILDFINEHPEFEKEIIAFSAKQNESLKFYHGLENNFQYLKSRLNPNFLMNYYCLLAMTPPAIMALCKSLKLTNAQLTEVKGAKSILSQENISGRNMIYGLGSTDLKEYNGLVYWAFTDKDGNLLSGTGEAVPASESLSHLTKMGTIDKISYTITF